ncbi:hypothetical protein [Chryseobacterium indologenes]|uniref:hypothetical protein n=1 Tax=Chryseobacterium indologenes TaxID=253 RepID=UPI000786FCF3|nr:hypothetical protein [Chryseobacterium indologenes]
MINLIEENEIVRYLTSKKLSYGLLLEIKDHFMLQISDLMEEKNIGFQEAFLMTKMNWQHELEMVRADRFSFRKIARIEKNAVQARFRNIAVNAVIASFLLSALVYFSTDAFIYLQLTLWMITVGLLLYNFIWRKMTLYQYLQFSFHPLVLRNTFIGAVVCVCVYFFFNGFTLYDTETLFRTNGMRLFFIYGMMTNVQLLYSSARRINVLI